MNFEDIFPEDSFWSPRTRRHITRIQGLSHVAYAVANGAGKLKEYAKFMCVLPTERRDEVEK